MLLYLENSMMSQAIEQKTNFYKPKLIFINYHCGSVQTYVTWWCLPHEIVHLLTQMITWYSLIHDLAHLLTQKILSNHIGHEIPTRQICIWHRPYKYPINEADNRLQQRQYNSE